MPQKLCNVQGVSFYRFPSHVSFMVYPASAGTYCDSWPLGVPVVTFKQSLYVYMKFEVLRTWFCAGHVINCVAHGLHSAYVQIRTLERSLDLQAV